MTSQRRPCIHTHSWLRSLTPRVCGVRGAERRQRALRSSACCGRRHGALDGERVDGLHLLLQRLIHLPGAAFSAVCCGERRSGESAPVGGAPATPCPRTAATRPQPRTCCRNRHPRPQQSAAEAVRRSVSAPRKRLSQGCVPLHAASRRRRSGIRTRAHHVRRLQALAQRRLDLGGGRHGFAACATARGHVMAEFARNASRRCCIRCWRVRTEPLSVARARVRPSRGKKRRPPGGPRLSVHSPLPRSRLVAAPEAHCSAAPRTPAQAHGRGAARV